MSNPSSTLAARLRLGILAPLAALFVACGGGGGSSGPEGPPDTGATITASTDTAAAAARAAVDSATAAVESSSSLSGLDLIPILPGATTSRLSRPQPQAMSSRQRPMASGTFDCEDLFDPGCSGTVGFSTNLSENATTASKGSYIELTFNDLSGTDQDGSWTLDGRVKVTFNTAYDPEGANNNIDWTIRFSGLTGSVNGVDFGPVSAVARFELTNQGRLTVTLNGRSFSDLAGVWLEGDGNYTIGSGRVRSAYWGDANRYVDVDLTDWSVNAGRPTVGSQATITAASGSIEIEVASVTSTTVVYNVSITVGDVTRFYVVTATYPEGGGAPTYVAEEQLG